MNPKQLQIIRHSLGVGDKHRDKEYRNRFFTGPGGTDFPICSELVALGFMQDHGPQSMCSGMHCFTVTDAGRAESIRLRNLKPEKKLTRDQRRYKAFLNEDCGLKFGQWLKMLKHRTKEQMP